MAKDGDADTGPHISSLLFVCSGNTCRSPMAAALAKRFLPDPAAVVESAGTDAAEGAPASRDAIKVMADRNLDITGHSARNIRSVRIDRFTHIVAMTPSIAECLSLEGVDKDRVVVLDITDPFGQGEEAYRRCADIIQGSLERIFGGLSSFVSSAPPPEVEVGSSKATILYEWHEVCAYVQDAETRLAQGKLEGSHLHGVMGRALTRFEVLLRATLKHLLTKYGTTYEALLKPELKKDIDALTLGETIRALLIIDEYARRSNPRERVLTKAVKKKLELVASIRRDLHHRYERVTEAERMDVAKQLFVALGQLLSASVFAEMRRF